MNKETKVLYAQNKAKIQDAELNLNYCQNLIQNAVTEFSKIAPITLSELQSLFNDYRITQIDKLEELVKDKLVEGKGGNISGLQLDTDRLKQLIILPDLTRLTATLDKFKLPIECKTITAPDVIYWQFYSIGKNNKVKILPDAIDILTQSYKAYAETPEQLQRLTEALKLCDALTNFIKSYPEINPAIICNNNLIEYGNNEFIPSPNFINLGRI